MRHFPGNLPASCGEFRALFNSATFPLSFVVPRHGDGQTKLYLLVSVTVLETFWRELSRLNSIPIGKDGFISAVQGSGLRLVAKVIPTVFMFPWAVKLSLLCNVSGRTCFTLVAISLLYIVSRPCHYKNPSTQQVYSIQRRRC